MAPYAHLRCNCVSCVTRAHKRYPNVFSLACLQCEIISLLLRFNSIYRSQFIWRASTNNIFMYSLIHWVIQRQQHNVRQHTHQWNRFKIQSKKITSLIAKSLRISIPAIYKKEIVLRVWPYNCITLGGDLVKPDWRVLWQATIAHIADIRHRGVTNMSGVIKKNVCYVAFENKTRVIFYPSGCYTPCYHTPVAKLLSTVVLLQMFVMDV